jgi:hypothetical protein
MQLIREDCKINIRRPKKFEKNLALFEVGEFSNFVTFSQYLKFNNEKRSIHTLGNFWMESTIV